jgi:soluble lytic murein transglycosylase
MSNHRGLFSSVVLAGLLAAQTVRAQSASLLEAVRAGEPQAESQARAELEACLKQRCPAADQLRLLAGVLRLSAGAPAEAATLLAGGRPPRGLGAFRAWYLGEAQAWSGQRAQALRTLEGALVGGPPWLGRRVEARRAELQLDLGQASRARPVLERLAVADAGPVALLERALARLGTGDRAAGLGDLRLLALRFPAHPHGALALARLEALGPVTWSEQEGLERAQALLAGGQATQALAALAGLPSPPAPRAALLGAQALLAARREPEAVTALEAIAAGPSAAVSSEAAMTLARRLMRLDHVAEARRAFQRVEQSWPREASADEAGYLAAWLALNQGELGQAVEDFDAWERRHPESRRRDEARWFKALALIRLGRPQDALPALASLPAEFPRSPLVPQALYWVARLRQRAAAGPGPDGGSDEAAPQAYRALVSAFPGSLYARLALERLRELGADEAEPFPGLAEPLPPAAAPPPELQLAARLSACGLFRDAREEVEAVTARVATPADALRLGTGLAALGEYAAASALAAKHLWALAYTARDPAALALLYPRAWRATVERWALAHGVEPTFAWAIMKRESGFRPEVTSAADARGLMQLLPLTARQLALDHQVEPPEGEALYAPDTNVRFGTWYLGRLFKRLGHPALVAAAYNGGPGPVSRWVAERGEEPLDLWIEEIPFKETRAYVKQVLADALLYQALYGAGAPRLALTLPRVGEPRAPTEPAPGSPSNPARTGAPGPEAE